MPKRNYLSDDELKMLKKLGAGEVSISDLHVFLAEYVKPELVDGALGSLLVYEPCPDDPETQQTVHSKVEVIAAAAAIMGYVVAEMVREDEDAACEIIHQAMKFAHNWMHLQFEKMEQDADETPVPTVDGPGTVQ